MKNLDELINKHGTVGTQFEQYLFNVAQHYSDNYKSGHWESKTLEDEDSGFYLSLENNIAYEIKNCANYQQSHKTVEMDSKTFSLTIFAFACNIFGNHLYSDGQTMIENGEAEYSEKVKEMANDYFELYHYATKNIGNIIRDKQSRSVFFLFLD